MRGEKDKLWAVAFDVTRRPADLDSGSDPKRVSNQWQGLQRRGHATPIATVQTLKIFSVTKNSNIALVRMGAYTERVLKNNNSEKFRWWHALLLLP